jgi:hypothetical protein
MSSQHGCKYSFQDLMCTDLQSVGSKINSVHMHGNLKYTAYKLVRPRFWSLQGRIVIKYVESAWMVSTVSKASCAQMCTQAVFMASGSSVVNSRAHVRQSVWKWMYHHYLWRGGIYPLI